MLSALLATGDMDALVTCGFPYKGPVMRNFDASLFVVASFWKICCTTDDFRHRDFDVVSLLWLVMGLI